MNVIAGLPSDRVLGVRVPQQESLKEAEGAMAMAADQGASIVRNVGAKICAPLLRLLALSNTDKLVEDAQKQGFDGKDPGFAVKLPLSVRRKAWVASHISMEVACHLRSEESGDRPYATLILPVSGAAKGSMPDQKPEDAVSVGLGAMQMAYFMGTRLQADLPESLCDYVRTAAARKPTRQLEHDQAAIEAKVIEALPTPDD